MVLPCFAQAWLPPAGTGSVALSYQHGSFTGHLTTAGDRVPFDTSAAQSAILDFEYGVTNRLAFDFRLPYIAARYTAAGHSPTDSSLDDGSYHSAFQDFRMHLRYKLLDRPFTLTPLFGVVIPSHSYPVIGESAIGRDLREYHVGWSAARQLHPLAPRAFVQATYHFAFVQRYLNVPLNHSAGAMELGYFLKPALAVRALSTWQHTHGGLHFPGDVLSSPELFLSHDRLLAEHYWKVGGGVSCGIGRQVEIFGSAAAVIAGSDTHTGTAVEIGVSWNFNLKPAR